MRLPYVKRSEITKVVPQVADKVCVNEYPPEER